MHLDDVAIDFPTCRSSWRTRASLGRTRRFRGTHKPNVDRFERLESEVLSEATGAVRHTLLKDRILFGSDYPLITPERWMKDFEEAGFSPR